MKKISIIFCIITACLIGLMSLEVNVILAEEEEVKSGEVVYIDGFKDEIYMEFVNPKLALESFYRNHKVFLDSIREENKLGEFNTDNIYDYYFCLGDIKYDVVYSEIYDFDVFIDIYENTEKNILIKQLINEYSSGNESIKWKLAKLMPNNTQFAKKNLPELSSEKSVNSLFNINSGVSYAESWAWLHNSNYDYILGGDCANFCSQILEAGGYPQWYTGNVHSGWWHLNNGSNTSSESWRFADDLCDYFGVDYSTGNHHTFSVLLEKGNIICRDNNGDGDWDHVGFVSQKESYYNSSLGYIDYTVCQHTADYCLKTSNSLNHWETINSNGVYGIIDINN